MTQRSTVPVRQTVDSDYAPVKRVCAYCRVSTGTDEQKKSFDAQVQYYTQKIAQNPNWAMTKIYTDEARSGTKVQRRDGFQQMIQDCKRGNIDLILTKSVTRFARNTLDSIHTIRMLKELGVEVYFEKEHIGTMSEKSEQLLTILSSIAQSESESISTNSRWSIQRRFQNGTYIIPTPAYGYTNDENGNIVIVPEEAEIVRRIFSEFLRGKGAHTIAKELQNDKTPTIRKAECWQERVVTDILKNPIYEGDLIFRKHTPQTVSHSKRNEIMANFRNISYRITMNQLSPDRKHRQFGIFIHIADKNIVPMKRKFTKTDMHLQERLFVENVAVGFADKKSMLANHTKPFSGLAISI